MKKPDVKLVSTLGKNMTRFGHVLSAVSKEAGLTQFELATRVDYSQPAISRIENGVRPLTPRLAGRLADVLGGTEDSWLAVFEETKSGSDKSLTFLKDQLLGLQGGDNLPGVRIRRMRGDDLVRFFDQSTGEMTFRGVTEDCEIADFDRDRVQPTSYDTVVGGHVDTSDPSGLRIIQAKGILTVPSKSTRLVVVKEHITLPSWLEAEIHPASNVALKGLVVSHGPIVDPGWSGYLRVSVLNPNDQDVQITTTEPFLTLRFWMQDSL